MCTFTVNSLYKMKGFHFHNCIYVYSIHSIVQSFLYIYIYIYIFIYICIYIFGRGGLYLSVRVSKCIDYNCILSVTVSVCHNKDILI